MADGLIKVGNVQLTSISDAETDHRLPLDTLFPTMSSADHETYQKRYPRISSGPNRWHINMGCFLLRSKGQTIVVDAGTGDAGGPVARGMGRTESGRLLEALRSVGSDPEEVDVLFLTHPHRDHVGWTVLQENGRPRLAFPRARYLLSQADWETFQRPEVKARHGIDYMEQAILPLKELGALELLAGDYAITDEVVAIETPGHTPGHRSILVTSNGQRALITGDTIVHPAQVTDPEITFSFDMDPVAAGRMRRLLLNRIEAEDMTMIAGHFPGPGIGRLVREDGQLSWQAVAYS